MVTSTSPDNFNSFGEALRFLRRRLHLTQEQLARAIGYSREHIVKLEHNQRRTDIATIRARFLPALELNHEPAWVERLITLAQLDAAPHHTAKRPEAEHTNLPLSLTVFIGRDAERAAAAKLVAEHRFVTIIGAGGMGKTRLALEVGRDLIPVFADGVCFVELATLTDGAQVPVAIATALIRTVVQDALAALHNHTRSRHILLILDNCEHLIAACAALGEQLLQNAPHLHILATSRETFGVFSAVAWRIPPLGTAAEPTDSDAVALFVNRATSVRPEFALTRDNAAVIARICRDLDGMPLAIELAATRTRAVGVIEIANHLQEHFTLMTGGNRTALPRHQTLRAALDWSYALLDEKEQTLFCAAAPFVGGFTRDGLAAAAGQDYGTETLLALVDKSLVNSDTNGESARYSLLETVRAYAVARLLESGCDAVVRRRHALHFADLATETRPLLVNAGQFEAFQRLDRDLGNIRAALQWCGENAPTIGLTYIASLWWYWFRRGQWREWLGYVERILRQDFAPGTAHLARALVGACQLAGISGDYKRMMRWAEAGRAIAEMENDHAALAWLTAPYVVNKFVYEEARPYYLDGIAHAQAYGDSWLEADITSMFGDRARMEGEWQEAEQFYRRSVKLFQSVGDRDMICNPLGNLGRLAFERSDWARARSAFEQSVALCRAMGNPISLSDWLRQLAIVAHHQGDLVTARDTLREGTLLCFGTGNTKGLADYLLLAVEIECLPGLATADEPALLHRATSMVNAAELLLEENALYRTVDPGSYADFERLSATLREVSARFPVDDSSALRALISLDNLVVEIGNERGADG